ncbi:VanW family protein [Actinocrispum wychmicini]|uniref:Vancomycin resistance protein YoaR n=1 Tax=Actinocrispum wychmicini TaxID=1213861 RepID=A0A4R2K4P9_9PSEU|nr:VanW family protein [Actinocrispum wychmicini]TCO64796.1 vancomycin resistance protein YoaR [Actinocrispum wychmicini]
MQPQWPESHDDQTDLLPVVQPSGSDEPTVQWTKAAPLKADRKRKSLRRKAAVVAGAVVGLFGVLYLVDLLTSEGDVPRGVVVAGVEVGGLSRASAEAKLREQIEPRLTRPVRLAAADFTTQVEPAKAGLAPDWARTLDNAGAQPVNPITRLTSFFTSRDVPFQTQVDRAALGGVLAEIGQKVDQQPVEGTITYDNGKPAIVEPKAGRKLDPAAGDLVVRQWADGKAIELPVVVAPVKVTPEAVRKAFDTVAKTAVSAPVVIKGDGKDATLGPAAIGTALTFKPADNGTLVPAFDQAKLVAAADPQLKSTEKDGKDAAIVFDGGKPTVQPSVDGKAIKWDALLAPLADAVQKATGREVKAEYAAKPAKVTTDQANQLGIKEVIGEFTTSGFAADSGVNIRTVAQKVNGAVVKPGDTFSLNGFTGPRGAPQGYVEAGVIENGAPAREVGGGISQFATTLYNAAYFAGMKDAGHKEHSFYISRYPAAREATVFQNPDGGSVIDLKFTNDATTGVAIQTIWTNSNITVRIWGTKRYNVESVPGPRTNPTDPAEQAGPAANCRPSNGAPGFTASDTRVIKDLNGNVVRKDTRTVKYNPQPKITCGPPA